MNVDYKELSVVRRPFPQCRGVVRSWGRGRRCRLLLQRICHCSGLPDRRGAAGRTGVFLRPYRTEILLPVPMYRACISRSEIQDRVLYSRIRYTLTEWPLTDFQQLGEDQRNKRDNPDAYSLIENADNAFLRGEFYHHNIPLPFS